MQDTALATWKADDENVIAAQTEFSKRTKFNGLAALGRYKVKKANFDQVHFFKSIFITFDSNLGIKSF